MTIKRISIYERWAAYIVSSVAKVGRMRAKNTSKTTATRLLAAARIAQLSLLFFGLFSQLSAASSSNRTQGITHSIKLIFSECFYILLQLNTNENVRHEP